MSNHEIWNELGNLYFMSGAYEPAIHAYLRSIQMDGKFGRSYSNLALTFVHTGKYAEAIKLYRRSIELLSDAKEKAVTWNRLGILYRQMRDYKNALEAYQQADVFDPQQNGAKGGVSFETKLPLTVSMPLIDLNSILGEDVPADAPPKEINVNKAQVKPQWFDNDLIPLDLEQIRRAAAGDTQAIEIPVSVNEEDEQNTQDEEIAETEDRSAQSEMRTESGQIMKPIESASEEMIESEVVQYSQTEYPLPELSPEEVKSIELDIAKYKAETINNPRNVSAWERLGDAYKSAGMYKDAIQAIKTAISNNSTKPAYYYRLGLMYAAERREAEAVLAFEKVLELNPKHALAHASLGSHYRKMGMNELAQTHIKLALNTNFEDENEYNRACLEAICGNTDRALELLQIALQTRQTYIKWAKTDPDLDSLHGDQRFKTLLSAFATSM